MVKSNSRQGKHREFENYGKTQGIHREFENCLEVEIKKVCAEKNCCVTLMFTFLLMFKMSFYYENTEGKAQGNHRKNAGNLAFEDKWEPCSSLLNVSVMLNLQLLYLFNLYYICEICFRVLLFCIKDLLK